MVLSLLGIVFLLVVSVALWSVNTRRAGSRPGEDGQKKVANQAEPQGPAVRLKQNPLTTNMSVGAVNGAKSPLIDQDTALASLERWIKQREGQAVEVVSAEGIHDLGGRLVSMNVLVTTNLGGGLSAQRLKERLAVQAADERALRDQLHKAYQDGNIAEVNRLVAVMSEMRTTFIATNVVSSYKVSLSKDRPPVLAFWPGLPFETVREGAAWNLAGGKLGADIGLQGLVHYSSATALLCFTNSSGGRVYVDPFRMEEVPLSALQSPRPRSARPDDDGREARIAGQWTDFLQQ